MERTQAKPRVTAKGFWARIKGAPWRGIGSTLVAIGVVAGLVVPIVHAAGIKADAAAVWVTAEGVVVAAVALLAAAAAAVFAYPAFRDWQIAQPKPGDIELIIEATSAAAPDDLQPVEPDEPYDIAAGRLGMYVRVAVLNRGRGVVRDGVLNIAVPAEWQIRPDDDPRVVHYLLRATALNGAIEPGQAVRVKSTAVRDDFPPGVRMYHVQIDGPLPQGAQVKLLADLTGTGLQSALDKVVTLVAH